MTYLVALNERPFSDYSSLLELEKLHKVKFIEKYEHRNSCGEFINYTRDYLFSKYVKNKLLRTNFIGVLNDGTTDEAIVEQEVIHFTFQDPNNFEPHLTVTEFNKSKDAQGLKRALFEDHNIEGILYKIVFLALDRASVNSILKSGLITLLKQDFE